MALIKTIGIAFLCASISTNVLANDESFDRYVEGALQVYSKFKEPSKQESEQFFAFIQQKWEKTECRDSCSSEGQQAGKEYVWLMNTPLEPEL